MIGLAPLAVPAALGVARAPDDFGGLGAAAVAACAALVVFVAPVGTFPAHALPGARAAARGARRARASATRWARAAAWRCSALLIVPGTLYRVDELRAAVNAGRQPFFLDGRGARGAALARPRAAARGGVLAPIYTGLLVPAWTGRETWVGAGSWTPRLRRARAAPPSGCSRGGWAARTAEALVRGSGARFLLSDCHGRADIEHLVSRVTGPPRRFGCATVWEVRR